MGGLSGGKFPQNLGRTKAFAKVDGTKPVPPLETVQMWKRPTANVKWEFPQLHSLGAIRHGCACVQATWAHLIFLPCAVLAAAELTGKAAVTAAAELTGRAAVSAAVSYRSHRCRRLGGCIVSFPSLPPSRRLYRIVPIIAAVSAALHIIAFSFVESAKVWYAFPSKEMEARLR